MARADAEGMTAARLAALLPRLVALTVIWLLGTSTFTFAVANDPSQNQQQAAAVGAKPEFLVVPEVRRQAYVFAKGILQDAGFAWRVTGSVQGFAANTVAVQTPAPGTKVVDNGEPTVVLRLERNPSYGERGLPENHSSYDGDRIVLTSSLKEGGEQPPAPERPPAPPTTEPPPEPEPETRKPDFVVPGAPPEPADEMPLPDRARMLGKRLAAKARPTKALVNYWLYQHAWIVTGARFGWSDGAEALRILIRVDRELEERWGFGARSAALARRALAEVERKAK